jgi:integrase
MSLKVKVVDLGKYPKGWLTSPKKKEYRFAPVPVSEKRFEKVVALVLSGPHTRMSGLMGKFLRVRDAAILAMLWLFGKRVGEIVKLKTEDVWVENGELKVRFTIQKKVKRYKLCECGVRNARDAVYCKKCGKELKVVKTTKAGQPVVRIKRKKLSVSYVNLIINYMDMRKQYPNGYFFVPLGTVGKAHHGVLDDVKPITDKPMSRVSVWYMLDKYVLSPHLFRYNLAKRIINIKRDIMLAREAGDWSKVDTLLEYAKSMGVTREDEEFAEL